MMIGHSVLPGNQSFGHPDFFRTMSYVRRQNESLASGHLYGKQLFIWLSLVVSFCAVFFPTGCPDEIWDVIESVSEGFLTYFCFLV